MNDHGKRTMTGKPPHFICIGAPKSGTSWLYDRLSQHPGVYIAPAKGTNFFDREYHRGSDWYLANFRAAPDDVLRGEISHDYYSDPKVPSRIAADLPDVKLICILREPGDFISSNIRWLLAHTKSYGDGVSGIWANPEIKANTRYAQALESYRTWFGPDQLLVLYYEDLKTDPEAFLANIWTFLGAAPIASPDLTERVNPTRASRFPVLMRIVFSAARLVRSLGLGGTVERAKRNRVLAKVLYSSTAVAMSESDQILLNTIKAEVRLANSQDFDAIGALAGRPVPDQWRNKAKCE